MSKANINTRLQQIGRNPEKYDRCVNTPIYRTSTFVYDDVYKFFDDDKPFHTDINYGRSGTTTVHELEQSISYLEGADHTMVTSSGMSAITTTLLAFLKPGDHLLMVETCYKCTRRFCDEELLRLGVEFDYFDPNIGAEIAKLIKPNTRMIFMESPGSGTFEVMDVPVIASIARAKGIVTVLDNTWATPLHFKGIEKGVDIIVQSLTKYFSGHADVIMGAISCKNEQFQSIRRVFRNYGMINTPDNAFYILRSIRTLAVRLETHYNSGLAVAKWLENQPYVQKVMHPALESFPSHSLWKRDFTGAAGVFGAVLKKVDKDTLYKAINKLQYFGVGLSWGGFESLIIPYDFSYNASIASRHPEGICIRLNIGLESHTDLINDLDNALKNL